MECPVCHEDKVYPFYLPHCLDCDAELAKARIERQVTVPYKKWCAAKRLIPTDRALDLSHLRGIFEYEGKLFLPSESEGILVYADQVIPAEEWNGEHLTFRELYHRNGKSAYWNVGFTFRVDGDIQCFTVCGPSIVLECDVEGVKANISAFLESI